MYQVITVSKMSLKNELGQIWNLESHKKNFIFDQQILKFKNWSRCEILEGIYVNCILNGY